jgi:hypothetical protein
MYIRLFSGFHPGQAEGTVHHGPGLILDFRAVHQHGAEVALFSFFIP